MQSQSETKERLLKTGLNKYFPSVIPLLCITRHQQRSQCQQLLTNPSRCKKIANYLKVYCMSRVQMRLCLEVIPQLIQHQYSWMSFLCRLTKVNCLQSLHHQNLKCWLIASVVWKLNFCHKITTAARWWNTLTSEEDKSFNSLCQLNQLNPNLISYLATWRRKAYLLLMPDWIDWVRLHSKLTVKWANAKSSCPVVETWTNSLKIFTI